VLPNLQNLIQRELNSSERLLWTGAPRQGVRLRSSDAFMIPFSLLWGGFAIFWEFTAIRHTPVHAGGAPSSFLALWGIPFVLAGLYLMVGRFFADAFQRARTAYAVTDQRILVLTTTWNKHVKSVPLQSLPQMSLTEKSDGSGTIVFGPEPPYQRLTGGGWPGTNRQLAPAFELIERVRSVYDLIQESCSERIESRRRSA
jgi:hypothetical protein